MWRDEYQDLLGLIYDGVLDQTHWQTLTSRLREITRAESTLIQFRGNIRSSPEILIHTGIEPDYMKKYSEYYYQCDVYVADVLEKKVKVDEVYTSDALQRQQNFKCSELYNDFMLPYRLSHLMSGIMEINTGRLGCISSIGSSRRGAFSLEHQQMFQALVPHLRRALKLHERIQYEQRQKHVISQALDHLSAGVILLDREMRIQYVNLNADSILSRSRVLTVKQGILDCAKPWAAALQKKVAQAATTATPDTHGRTAGGYLSLPGMDDSSPLELAIVPLTNQIIPELQSPSLAAVFMFEPFDRADLESLLSALYRLTPAETRLAALLIRGHSLTEAAARMPVTINTAKTHLKHVFDKTDCKRQAELIHAVLSGPVGHLLR